MVKRKYHIVAKCILLQITLIHLLNNYFFLYSYIFKDVLSISSNFLFHLIYLMIIIINDKYHIYATLILYYASFANIFIL